MRIILLGSPGAGKGTQAQFIQAKFNIPQISTGNILRAEVGNGSELGLKAQAFMRKGELVPDSVIIEMVIERIKQADCQNGFLFDGFPRTIPQAEALVKACISIDVVIEITVEDEIIVRRLSGRRVHPGSDRVYHEENHPPKKAGFDDVTGEPLVQREDDKESTIRNRLMVYHQQTEPLIEFYRELSKMEALEFKSTLQKRYSNDPVGYLRYERFFGDKDKAQLRDEIFKYLDNFEQ